jgi:phage gp29-like protein
LGDALQEYSWITHLHKARSGYLTNTALARVTVWPFLFRAFSSRDFAEFLEIYGLPMRLGRYPSGATDEERSTLLRAVTAIGHSAAGILPANMAIEFQRAAEGEADPYMAMVSWAERGISKAILGGTLTSEVDGKGSYAAAGVHDDVRMELRQADLRMLAKTLTRDLIRPLVLFNTGITRVPQLVFDDSTPEDMQMYADSLPKLANVMPIPLGWVQQKLKIPAPIKDEPLLQASSLTQGMAAARSLQQGGCSCCPPTAMAALKASHGQEGVQEAIDASAPTDNDLRTQAQALIQPLIDKALQGIRAGESAETILTTLMMGYPEMDDIELNDAIAQALFIADLMGRWEAQQDIGNGKA